MVPSWQLVSAMVSSWQLVLVLLHHAHVPVSAQFLTEACPAGYVDLGGKCVHSESDPNQITPATLVAGYSEAAYELLWKRKTSVRGDGTPTDWAPVLCSHDRLVPSTFLIGGTKSGTTSFFHSFSEATPFVTTGSPLPSEAWWSRKEKLYWTNHYQKGRQWYLQHYPECPGAQQAQQDTFGDFNAYVPSTRSDGATDFQVAIDMTANVFQFTPSPVRIIRAFGPQLAKKLVLMVMVKDDAAQVARSSMYMGMREENLPSSSSTFAHRVRQQVRAAQSCEAHLAQSASFNESGSIYSRDCARSETHDLRQAAYAPLLRHWLRYFDPGQFVLISSAAFFANPQQVIAEVAGRLRVPFAHDTVDFEQKLTDQRWNNINTRKTKMEEEDLEAFKLLEDYLGPLQDELSELLVEHVQHGDMKFIGDMTPFIRK